MCIRDSLLCDLLLCDFLLCDLLLCDLFPWYFEGRREGVLCSMVHWHNSTDLRSYNVIIGYKYTMYVIQIYMYGKLFDYSEWHVIVLHGIVKVRGCVHTTQFPCNFLANIACILRCKRIAPSCTHLYEERFTGLILTHLLLMIGRKWIKDKVIHKILKTFRMHGVDSSWDIHRYCFWRINSHMIGRKWIKAVSYTHLTLPTILLV